MLDVLSLTIGTALLASLGIALTPTPNFLPTHVASTPNPSIAHSSQARDSRVPDSVKQQYRQEAAQLALRLLIERNSPASNSVELSSSPPRSSRELSSGIEGRSTSKTMPGIIRLNPDGTQPTIKPFISPTPIPIAILDRRGRQVTRIQPDKDGYFRVRLEPGVYTIAPEFQPSNFLQLSNGRELQKVTVTEGKFTTADITYTVLAP
jgi:hypothetical protein